MLIRAHNQRMRRPFRILADQQLLVELLARPQTDNLNRNLPIWILLIPHRQSTQVNHALGEINDFEEQLSEAGVVLVKFWLSIDQQTQLERFKAREQIPFKRFKITEEDWRNREKWPLHRDAVGDMVDRTSTEIAPWTLVEANDKRFARIKVLRTINEALEAAFAKN